jgi:hypothetical protein
MRWVTRRRIRVNRTATAWLIRRFIDPNAVFLFVAPEEVAEIERTTGAIGFDAPGARYPHLDANGMRSIIAALTVGAEPTLFDAMPRRRSGVPLACSMRQNGLVTRHAREDG